MLGLNATVQLENIIFANASDFLKNKKSSEIDTADVRYIKA